MVSNLLRIKSSVLTMTYKIQLILPLAASALSISLLFYLAILAALMFLKQTK